MPIKMVREPSQTPNINNIDDIIPMRYAYGGQNGFVKGKGTEIGHTISGLDFTIGAGRLVLQGVECDIDAIGVTKTINNIATKQYFTVYLKVNLAMNQTTIEILSSLSGYPEIQAGDDLTKNNLGIANMELYHFTATNGIIADVQKIVKEIKYTKGIKVDNAINSDNSIKKEDGTYKGFIEKNNVLQVEDFVVTKKRLIFNGQLQKGTTYSLMKSVNPNAKLEIIFEGNGSKQQFPTYLYDFSGKEVVNINDMFNSKGISIRILCPIGSRGDGNGIYLAFVCLNIEFLKDLSSENFTKIKLFDYSETSFMPPNILIVVDLENNSNVKVGGGHIKEITEIKIYEIVE